MIVTPPPTLYLPHVQAHAQGGKVIGSIVVHTKFTRFTDIEWSLILTVHVQDTIAIEKRGERDRKRTAYILTFVPWLYISDQSGYCKGGLILVLFG